MVSNYTMLCEWKIFFQVAITWRSLPIFKFRFWFVVLYFIPPSSFNSRYIDEMEVGAHWIIWVWWRYWICYVLKKLQFRYGWERRVWDHECKLNEMDGKIVFPTSSFEAHCDGCSPWEKNKLICKYNSVRLKEKLETLLRCYLIYFMLNLW